MFLRNFDGRKRLPIGQKAPKNFAEIFKIK